MPWILKPGKDWVSNSCFWMCPFSTQAISLGFTLFWHPTHFFFHLCFQVFTKPPSYLSAMSKREAQQQLLSSAAEHGSRKEGAHPTPGKSADGQRDRPEMGWSHARGWGSEGFARMFKWPPGSTGDQVQQTGVGELEWKGAWQGWVGRTLPLQTEARN